MEAINRGKRHIKSITFSLNRLEREHCSITQASIDNHWKTAWPWSGNRTPHDWAKLALTSPYLILSSYMYWGPGAFLPIFSFLVSSLTKILLPSQRLAWVKLYCAAVFSTERGSLPKEVCACSLSSAWAKAVRSTETRKRRMN